MSGDKFKKTAAGRPLEIPAATWNAMVDAARSHVEQQHDQSAPTDGLFRQGDIVKVRNQSGQSLDRFAVLGIDSPAIDPQENQREFKNHVALNAVTPTAQHRGRFVVLLEPLAGGRIGKAWLSGVCPARINVLEDWHSHADIQEGDSSSLTSHPAGSAQILWKEPGTGLKWAVVRLSSAHRSSFLIRVPTNGIPARYGAQTGSAACEIYTFDESGTIEPASGPARAIVFVTVRHYGTQPIRGPIDPNQPQFLGVTFDGHHSWLLDSPKHTLLCKPLQRLKSKSCGTARELRFNGVNWQPIALAMYHGSTRFLSCILRISSSVV